MQLVKQIQLTQSKLLDDLTFYSKNLFNVATFTVRQCFFKEGYWIRYYELWKELKNHKDYQILQDLCGSHPPQQVLRQVDQKFKSFFKAIKEWKKDASKFTGRPKLPHYKRKYGKNIVIFTELQCRIKDGFMLLTNKLMKAGFPKIKTDFLVIKGVRIVPFGDRYNIELIYDFNPNDLQLNQDNIIGVDIGLNNVVTTSDNMFPIIIKGGILKSINQFYNKQLAKFKSEAKICNKKDVTRRIQRIYRKRNNKVRDFFHKSSRLLINRCISHNIGKIVIGYNEGWKRNINKGKRFNQNFAYVTFLKLIQQIEYKAEMVGISVIITSEEYTSQKCSHCGIIRKSNRKFRGLYVCKNCGSTINADVNGADNILQKEIPESVRIRDRGRSDPPIVLNIS